uniref:Uncharacterized protein n=1 Tax=Panulirus argus virus 1 TaxID=380624 RepID=A0A6G9HEA8_9VIRU|nr:hypothetical protein [Panulirus argus virus 1]
MLIQNMSSTVLHQCNGHHKAWVSDSTIDLPTNSNVINVCISGIQFVEEAKRQQQQQQQQQRRRDRPAAGSVSVSVLQNVYIHTLGKPRWIPFVCKELVYISADDIFRSNALAVFDRRGEGTRWGLFNKTFKKELGTHIPYLVNNVVMEIKCHGDAEAILLEYSHY